jgi:hypothetical protein
MEKKISRCILLRVKSRLASYRKWRRLLVEFFETGVTIQTTCADVKEVNIMNSKRLARQKD